MRHDDGGHANARYDVLHAASHASSDLPVPYLLNFTALAHQQRNVGICRLEQQRTCAKWVNILKDLKDHPGKPSWSHSKTEAGTKLALSTSKQPLCHEMAVKAEAWSLASRSHQEFYIQEHLNYLEERLMLYTLCLALSILCKHAHHQDSRPRGAHRGIERAKRLVH